MSPNETLLREHLSGGAFRAAVHGGRWRVVGEIMWPNVILAVTAAAHPNGPREFALRFDMTDYAQRAPTSTPWDCEEGASLSAAKRPKGERVGHVFRTDWKDGVALYAAYDRVALEDHGDWPQKYAQTAWTP